MAVTEFGVNHNLAVKLYSKKLMREALKKCWGSKFFGSGADAMVQVNPELKEVGDKLTYGLRMLLSGDGVQGDATLEGSEEALTLYSDSIMINQLRHAVRSAGKMSEQRVPYSIRNEAMDALSDWFADRIDCALMNQLAGNSNISDTKWTGNNTATAADATHIHYADPNVSTDGSFTASSVAYFTLGTLDVAVQKAKLMTPKMRPLMIGGEEKFICFIHPWQHLQLRQNTNTGQYVDIQKAAMMGGQVSKNPLYTGAIAEWNGVIIHESSRVPWGTAAANTAHPNCAVGTASIGYAILGGAQAAVLCTGRNTKASLEASWTEKLFDYGNQLGVAGGLIFGLKKTYFNSMNFGAMTIKTYSPAV